MKNTTLKSITIALLPFLVLFKCSTDDKQADAYGNFEIEGTKIASQAQGEIVSLSLEEGDKLDSKEEVGIIDTTRLSLKKAKIKNELQSLRATRQSVIHKIQVQKEKQKNILIEKNRIKNLWQDSATTKQKWDEIKGRLRVMNAQIKVTKSRLNNIKHKIESLRKELGIIKDKLNKCQITNPINGRVLEKYVNEHEIATPGKPIYKIANLDNIYLNAYISGGQLPNIELGQKVQVIFDKNAEESQSVPGQVSWISEKAEFTPDNIQTKETRVDLVYPIKIDIENTDKIKAGMPGEVKFK